MNGKGGRQLDAGKLIGKLQSLVLAPIREIPASLIPLSRVRGGLEAIADFGTEIRRLKKPKSCERLDASPENPQEQRIAIGIGIGSKDASGLAAENFDDSDGSDDEMEEDDEQSANPPNSSACGRRGRRRRRQRAAPGKRCRDAALLEKPDLELNAHWLHVFG